MPWLIRRDEGNAYRGEHSNGAGPDHSRDNKEEGSDGFDAPQEHEVRVRVRRSQPRPTD